MFPLYKILFFSTLISSTLISISSQSWMGMWMGLEINLLSFIPLMNEKNNMMSTESSIKYFIVQALASTIILMSIIMMSNILPINNFFSSMILNSALFMKMGAAPFHFWFPEMIEGLNWTNTLILLTWQKLAPMVIFSYKNNSMMSMFVIISCMLISGIIGLNQLSLRKIMAYSSINHLGWMISSMMYSQTIWIIYYMIYIIMSINIIWILKKYNIFYLKQMFYHMKYNKKIKIFFMCNFLSLGGLPPFIGFFPKWITIHILIMNQAYIMCTIMVILTLVTIFIYTRMTFSTILLSASEINFKINNYHYNKWLILSNFVSLLGLLICTLMINLN